MFKKLLHIEHASPQTDVGLLVLRIAFGGLMMRYGWQKLANFSEYASGFLNFLWLGSEVSLGLATFAELFCAFLIVIGLFTRWATMPLIITMLVAFFQAHADDTFDVKEHPLVFLFPYIALLMAGAGRFSIDGVLFGMRRKY
ncbi:MAG: DoxX family protein [Cytophagales bacterium]|nr:MAG: DoxX family protein [Cytophagales bacterium]